MSGGERVIEHLDAGYGCAEAMVVAYSDVVGMPRSLCRVATPFGGGMGRTGKICGLVSAAVMVLGWVFGRDDAHDLSEKERAYRIVSEFIRDVEAAWMDLKRYIATGAAPGLAGGEARAREAMSVNFKLPADYSPVTSC